MHARLVPIGPVLDAWLVSGAMRAFRKSDAAQVAGVALELAMRPPELVYRNPGKLEQAWQQMRSERAALVEFFGRDELVLPPAEAEERVNVFYRHQQEAARARRPDRRRRPGTAGVDLPALDFPPFVPKIFMTNGRAAGGPAGGSWRWPAGFPALMLASDART